MDCSIPCPKNCQEANCHILDGTCLGCTEGYTGLRCDKGTHVRRLANPCTILSIVITF